MVLEVKNVSKVFTVGLFSRHKIEAVKDVSMRVEKGEIVSLVGESGSGKTTLCRIILRLLEPTSGSIIYDGIDVTKLRGKKLKWYWRKVHGVFQDPYAAFHPFYRVENILYQAFNLMPKVEEGEKKRRVHEALKSVGLNPDEVLGKFPHELSGGMRQRIAIARCFILNPELIVADEPVSMLDASTRIGIIKLFSDMRDRLDSSVIFVTHDLGLAYVVSDRVLIMYKGVIVEEGNPVEVMEYPSHPYTKRLREDVPLLYRKWEGF
ncbi:MAG: dipeptide/oligopeptide/nickel ABC transporter ATP-binding protein [Nitrososphaerota archaeon]|nr:dipeptide/oligopeptide/nickel ABC transporter ATP-binding protein [Candidatus Calditenuaceae archaeon]MDW8073421.1 dipeptide/oligopeptide/nickel ABC transporter ATP-binding protein [Nitrososphaerota archaeon]